MACCVEKHPVSERDVSIAVLNTSMEDDIPLLPFEGSLSNKITTLQEDLEKSHKRALEILKPHLKDIVRLEYENAVLQAENLRLRDQSSLRPLGPQTFGQVRPSPKETGIETDPVVDDEDSQSLQCHVLDQEPKCEREEKAQEHQEQKEVKTKSEGRRMSNAAQAPSNSEYSPTSPTTTGNQVTSLWNEVTKSRAENVEQHLKNVVRSGSAEIKEGAPDRDAALTKASSTLATDSGPVKLSDVANEDEMAEKRLAQWRQQNKANMEKDNIHVEVAPIVREGLRARIAKVIEGSGFEMFFGLVIVSSSVFIGVEADYTAKNPTDDIPLSYQIIGYIYTLLFTVELVLRLYVDRSSFFYTETSKMMWNYLDLVIVIFSLLEVLLDIIKAIAAGAGNGEGVNLKNLRIVRIIRITKLMRLFRIGRIVRFVRALRSLIISILSTFKAVLWALLLLLIIIYIFAILLMQAASTYTLEISVGEAESRLSEAEDRDLALYWGTLAKSMLTLFMAISGGVNWADVSKPLEKIHISSMIILLAFISFVYFAVLNVITGVFCEAAMQSQVADQDAMLQSFLANKHLYTKRFMQLFKSLDSDHSGIITKEEFETHIEEGAVDVYFAMLGLEASDARTLFYLLDTDEDEEPGIDAEEFVHGCLRLKGYAKAVDLARVQHDSARLTKDVRALLTMVRSALEGRSDMERPSDNLIVQVENSN